MGIAMELVFIPLALLLVSVRFIVLCVPFSVPGPFFGLPSSM